ncbi:MAG: acyl carrier protein [Bryobacteraceae bacterium]
MSDLDARLSSLFLAAFPGLDVGAVRAATQDSTAGWDSVATVMLASLVEEEFGEGFDMDEAADWSSYQAVRLSLEKRLSG